MSKSNSGSAQSGSSTQEAIPRFVGSDEKCSPWLLFGMPVGVGFLLSLVVVAVKVINAIDAKAFYLGLDGLRPLIASALIFFAVSAVAMIWFRPKLRTLLVASGVLLVMGFAAYKLVRVESFYGNMVPRLAWSWTPSTEEQVQQYFVSKTSSDRSVDSVESQNRLFEATNYDFAEFLGANRDGVVSGVQLAGDWETNPPIELWRHPIGLGWSSFAIRGHAAINLEQRGENECVVCYHAETGEEIWSYADCRRFEDEHGDGPRSTPTIVDNRVYSIGADGLLCCLDLFSGDLVWKQETLEDKSENLLWGMSGSPLVFDDKVVVTPGGEDGAAICFSALDGEKLWQSASAPGGYASPTLASVAGQEVILSFNGSGLTALGLTGEILWVIPWLTQGELQRVNVAQPIVLSTSDLNRSRILISSGYGNGTALFEVTYEEHRDEPWESKQVWLSKRLKSKMSNFVVRDDYIFGLDSGILTCISMKDGKRQWKRGRYGHGQMLLVDDKLLIQTESGAIALVAANPNSFAELGELNALDGKTWNNLALAGNVLIVRNDHEAAAFELPLITPLRDAKFISESESIGSDSAANVNRVH